MAIETTITPERIAVALGQPTPPAGLLIEAQWESMIGDVLMFIRDRAEKLNVTDIDTAKVDFVVREVVVDQIKRRDTDVDAEFPDNYRFRTVADWWPLLGLTDRGGAYAVDMLGTYSAHLPWCSSMFGALYCSCGVDIAGYPIFEGGGV